MKYQALFQHSCFRLICTYILWIIIHSVSNYLYHYLCAYPSISGFIYSLLTINAPHCRGLHYLSESSIYIMKSFWISLSLWLTQEIIRYFPILKKND